MKMKRLLSAAVVAAAGIVLASAPSVAPAQTYPTKTVTIINPFAAGGSLDVMARLLADQLTQSLGQPVIVENRAGAGSTIGTGMVARARPDGYTLLITAANIVSAPALGTPVNYDWKKDFAPVTLLGNIAQVLAVPEDLPAKNLKEFVALAKSTKGGLSIGSLGPGSGSHINGKRLEEATGVALTDIPFKGMAETMTALAGGHIQLAFGNLPEVLTYQRGGRVRPIAIAMPTRSELAPGLPTVAESGYPNVAIVPWYGVLAPAGTPPDVVAKLQRSFAAALAQPALAARLKDMAITPIGSSPEEFRRVLEEDHAMYVKIGKEMGVTLK
ncbi:Argininosuccinate lyase [Variovorax sp. PBS-H4]|uniref:Bug family tripartite tricarboxylate transporter substrate binding protein n=1 Tax=Variovorax sp. PBS-H4 TaxID=434008 RepID=UPI001318EB10|nr:tripartite tricarboxylate transporter substrate binding protein [Variovorax sp. PBS-H4]VTU18254.1 Argininosuccinate lyase [Variovorax sp. PBS-H4]